MSQVFNKKDWRIPEEKMCKSTQNNESIVGDNFIRGVEKMK